MFFLAKWVISLVGFWFLAKRRKSETLRLLLQLYSSWHISTAVAAAADSCIAVAILTQLDDVSYMMSSTRGSIQH